MSKRSANVSPQGRALVEQALHRHRAGNLGEAKALYRRAISLDKRNPQAHQFLGALMAAEGDLKAGTAMVAKALKWAPKNPMILYNLGALYREGHELLKAERCFREAASVKPDYVQAHFGLAAVLQQRGNFKEAEAAIRKVIEIAGSDPAAMTALANLVGCQGRLGEAVTIYCEAYERYPEEESIRLGLIDTLRGWQPTRFSASLRHTFLRLLDTPGIQDQGVAHVVVALLKLDPRLSGFRALANLDSDTDFTDPSRLDDLENDFQDPLLLAAMTRLLLADRTVELALTAARRLLLIDCLRCEGRRLETYRGFIFTLAHYTFYTEYIFSESAEEERLLKGLYDRLLQRGEVCSDPGWQMQLALFASYRPLSNDANLIDLLTESEEPIAPEMRALTEEQICEPQREAVIWRDVESLTPVEDAVSQAVQNQYEENPYPRWTHIQLLDAQPTAQLLVVELPHLSADRLEKLENPSILVAGCGTGRQAIYAAATHANSKVLAIDLSRHALAYGIKMASDMGVENIDFKQADILELGSYPERFDIIEAGGVIHHLRDPAAGLKVLASLLKPHGLVKLGLYSELARRDIVRTKALIAEEGFRSDREGIRACRQVMFSRPSEPSFRKIIEKSPDFYSLSNCRDLLFHAQEHRFTIEGIRIALEECGLRCEAFILPLHLDFESFGRQHPVSDGSLNWKALQAFEEANPDAFASMYFLWASRF